MKYTVSAFKYDLKQALACLLGKVGFPTVTVNTGIKLGTNG